MVFGRFRYVTLSYVTLYYVLYFSRLRYVSLRYVMLPYIMYFYRFQLVNAAYNEYLLQELQKKSYIYYVPTYWDCL